MPTDREAWSWKRSLPGPSPAHRTAPESHLRELGLRAAKAWPSFAGVAPNERSSRSWPSRGPCPKGQIPLRCVSPSLLPAQDSRGLRPQASRLPPDYPLCAKHEQPGHVAWRSGEWRQVGCHRTWRGPPKPAGSGKNRGPGGLTPFWSPPARPGPGQVLHGCFNSSRCKTKASGLDHRVSQLQPLASSGMGEESCILRACNRLESALLQLPPAPSGALGGGVGNRAKGCLCFQSIFCYNRVLLKRAACKER